METGWVGSGVALLAFVAAVMATASGGALFRPGQWYEGLRHPSWRPPNWLFGPVWAVLYGMIAVSGWLVWEEMGGLAAAWIPFTVYGVQLALNFLWSAVFFGMRRIGLALFEMGLLWASIALTALLFYDISPVAGWLLAPYLLWVTFAFALNATLWRLNGPSFASTVGQ